MELKTIPPEHYTLKSNDYFTYFRDLFNKVEDVQETFLDILNDYDHCEAGRARLKRLAFEADGESRMIIETMHRTFLPPLDPPDVYALAKEMALIARSMETISSRMQLYGIKPPFPEILEQTRIFSSILDNIGKAVRNLYEDKRAGAFTKIISDIRLQMIWGKEQFYSALRNLFEKEYGQIELLMRKEILERLYEATRQCAKAVRILEGIVQKME